MEREIDSLKKKILTLGAKTEEIAHRAVNALQNRNRALAEEVLAADAEIDHMEVDLEEECLKVLALNQPVAGDLRFIISILKINNELERIGDLAVNIAERARFLSGREKLEFPLDFPRMMEATRVMLHKAIDALVNRDAKLAHEVLASDDEIDAINREMYEKIQEGIRADPDQLESLIHLLSSSRHLERIADHATNIAEDVIYLVDGDIVRHKAEDFTDKS